MIPLWKKIFDLLSRVILKEEIIEASYGCWLAVFWGLELIL